MQATILEHESAITAVFPHIIAKQTSDSISQQRFRPETNTGEFNCAHKLHDVNSFLWKKIFDL